MTSEDFRRIALSLPGAIESAHMNHPDFRVNGKIFATLQYPADELAMVKLPPDRQAEFVELNPKAFSPVQGAWGRQGATSVLLKAANKESVEGALTLAWEDASLKKAKKK